MYRAGNFVHADLGLLLPRGTVSSYRQLFETLSKSINFTESWIISSMPRGGLQIVQPGNLDEARLKAYANEFHAHDAMSWRAIIADQPVCGRECWASSSATNSKRGGSA